MSNIMGIKVNNQSTKKTSDKVGKDSKKDTAVGLRVPGSNWQKFKTLMAETQSELNSENSQITKKKRNRRPPRNREQTSVSTLVTQQITNTNTEIIQQKEEVKTGLTKVIGMDCEMVGIGADGQDSMIARVSIVNRHGFCVYDKYVKPTEEVRDFRTAVSGIRPHHIKNGEDFKVVQKEVSEILRGRILVGHALHNDLAVLFLNHPRRSQRDTSRYKPFRKFTNGSTPSLKKLAAELLGIDIQSGEHNSIEDAKTAMQLYQLFRKKWENDIRKKG